MLATQQVDSHADKLFIMILVTPPWQMACRQFLRLLTDVELAVVGGIEL